MAAWGPEAMGWTPPHLNGIDVPDWDLVFPVNSEKESEMKLSRVGVDLGKKCFSGTRGGSVRSAGMAPTFAAFDVA